MPMFKVDDVVRLRWDDQEENSRVVGKDLTIVRVLDESPPRWLIVKDNEGHEFTVRGDDCTKLDRTREKKVAAQLFYVIYDGEKDAYIDVNGAPTKDLNEAFLHTDEHKEVDELLEGELWVVVERRLSVVG